MPELPEVETIRAGIASTITSRPLTSVQILHPRTVRRSPGLGEAMLELVGETAVGVARRGKYMWIDFGTPLIIHLGMSGQVLVSTDWSSPDHPHLRARLDFGTTRLRFIDQRTFGHLQRAEYAPGDGAPAGYGTADSRIPMPLAHIARDLLDPHLDVSALLRSTRAKRTEIKRALLDQSLVSGLGNIYCDEALFRAQIHPRRKASGLPYARLEALYSHAADVLREALAAGGTSFDALYKNVEGAPGYFERSLSAYGRAGLPCLRCSATLVREQFMNRSSVFCPVCQPLST